MPKWKHSGLATDCQLDLGVNFDSIPVQLWLYVHGCCPARMSTSALGLSLLRVLTDLLPVSFRNWLHPSTQLSNPLASATKDVATTMCHCKGVGFRVMP